MGKCKGLCIRYKSTGTTGKNHYVGDNKRCTPCEEYITYAGFHCPCCGQLLRKTPKNRIYKAKMQGEVVRYE